MVSRLPVWPKRNFSNNSEHTKTTNRCPTPSVTAIRRDSSLEEGAPYQVIFHPCNKSHPCNVTKKASAHCIGIPVEARIAPVTGICVKFRIRLFTVAAYRLDGNNSPKELPLRGRRACRPLCGRQASGTPKVWHGVAVTEGVMQASITEIVQNFGCAHLSKSFRTYQNDEPLPSRAGSPFFSAKNTLSGVPTGCCISPQSEWSSSQGLSAPLSSGI